MSVIGHRLVWYLDDYGNPCPLTWNDGKHVYFDELNDKINELNNKISVFSQKYANYRKCRKPKMFDERQTKHIKKRRKEGASLRQIAKEMHCSEGTIRNYLKES